MLNKHRNQYRKFREAGILTNRNQSKLVPNLPIKVTNNNYYCIQSKLSFRTQRVRESKL
jgi:hypothetical protein